LLNISIQFSRVISIVKDCSMRFVIPVEIAGLLVGEF
jgi:hypothetical protein